jgi:hypothetical protein
MFTKVEQADHCDALIAFLDKLPNKKYDQLVQTPAVLEDSSSSCALGWATSVGVGGLQFKNMKIVHEDVHSPYTAIFPANHVFGEDAYQHVFAIWKPREQNEKSMTEKQLAVNRLKQLSQSLKKGSKVKLIQK